MNQNKEPILETLRTRRHTRDGRIVFWGSIVQFPAAVFLLWRAWSIFPQSGTDELLTAGLLHLAIPVSLAATFIEYGASLDFRESSVLTFLLALIACAPFFLSLSFIC